MNLLNLFPGSVKYIFGLCAFVNYSCSPLPGIVPHNREYTLFPFYLISVFCWHAFSKPAKENYDEPHEDVHKLYVLLNEWDLHTCQFGYTLLLN